ncbi:AEC family transporter [Ureibacillus chungkukjangi]|uniref:AEC family transporter n=1 Tax=Ureibacillus chungkukjangi TaxID=1202712 RepID=UPI002559C006|nr:AEC family transporter [Ureibacillus chungkukjangi]MCM3388214.1 AEC family transporter [Ureibacillus chungkukjangi]
MIIFEIIVTIILPMFVLIISGTALNYKFNLNLNTLSNILIYFFLPIVCFFNIYNTSFEKAVIINIILYVVLYNVSLIVLTILYGKRLNLTFEESATFKNGAVLSNSANYGIPVSNLVFKTDPVGTSVQVIIAVIQNVLTYTWGFLNASSVNGKISKEQIKKMLKIPIIYGLLLAVIMKLFNLPIPSALEIPLKQIDDGFIAIALLTLGAQISFKGMKQLDKVVVNAIIIRVLFSQVISLLILFSLGITGLLAKALFLSSSFPSNRSAALIALEYNNVPDKAAAIVVYTTILSPFTVAINIILGNLIFGA